MDYRIPLTIGITGHRNLRPDDIPGMEADLREFIGLLHLRFPHTPLLMISGLAEGADRLAVRIAMELHIPFLAVLPMRTDLYREDFPESVEEFDLLLGQAEQVIECPSSTIDSQPMDRNRGYQDLGAWLVRNSAILVTLWDGVTTNPAPGGTADVVRSFLSGQGSLNPQGSELLALPQCGAVFHIHAIRSISPAQRISGCKQVVEHGQK